MTLPLEAFFLPTTAVAGGPPRSGQRLCLFHPAQNTTPLGLVLYIHPFAEEMNKSRRMAALQSRALAQAGFAVLQIDLHGCGDSSGDFGDASWQGWVDDVLQGCQWLRARAGCKATSGAITTVIPGAKTSDIPGEAFNDGVSDVPLWLWGLRAGCLLAVAAAQRMPQPCHFLFWQPPISGKLLLQQFLRLKVAGDMMGGQAKGVMQAMRQQLAEGESVEIVGYMLAPGLANGLEQAMLAPPHKVVSVIQLAQTLPVPPYNAVSAVNSSDTVLEAGTADGAAVAVAEVTTSAATVATLPAQRVAWFELSTREDASQSPTSAQAINQWQSAGFQVSSALVQGPSFWQTTEIEDAPALIQATLSAVTTTPQCHPQSK